MFFSCDIYTVHSIIGAVVIIRVYKPTHPFCRELEITTLKKGCIQKYHFPEKGLMKIK